MLTIIQRNEPRWLPVPLTDDELLLRGNELARALEEKSELEERLKSERDDIKSEIGTRNERILKLRGSIRSKREQREVLCEWSRNDERMVMELHRQDSGEVIESRPMTAEERQEKLNLKPVPPRAKATADGE
jgi:hypothetical protein